MIARGKRRAQRGASPLEQRVNNRAALKERNKLATVFRTFSAPSNGPFVLGATRFAPLSARPWPSYFAPLALVQIKRGGPKAGEADLLLSVQLFTI